MTEDAAAEPIPVRPTWEQVASVVEELLGSATRERRAVDEGGYSYAGRWVVRTAGGSSAFIKAEIDRSDDHGVASEQRLLAGVAANCMPRLLGYVEDADTRLAVLATEDLSEARWGVPVTDADADALARAIDEVAGLDVDAAALGLGSPGLPARWAGIAANPSAAVATGVASLAWFERHAPLLAEAERDIDVSGSQLVHMDLWRQNWCHAERGGVIIDWPGAAVGSIDLSRAWAEAGVRAAGGPRGRVMPAGNRDWASWMAGQAVHMHSHHLWPAPPRLLETERREAHAALAWACAELEIELPGHAPGFLPPGPWRP